MCVGCLMLETLYDLSRVDVDECTTNMCVGCLMLETLYDLSCVDVDECTTINLCQQACRNVQGSYFCTCHRGYQLRDDKRSCEGVTSGSLFEIILLSIAYRTCAIYLESCYLY